LAPDPHVRWPRATGSGPSQGWLIVAPGCPTRPAVIKLLARTRESPLAIGAVFRILFPESAGPRAWFRARGPT